MNILIVGGAGYVGGALTDLLMKSNKHNIRVYDNLLFEDCFLKTVDFVLGDVRDTEKLKTNLKWADLVVWLAAIVGDGACQVNPKITFDVNQKVVEFLSKNFDGRIIYMSTCSVYGAMDGILTEESKTNPLSIYASTKLDSEKCLNDKNAIIFRLGTLCGKGDNYSRIRMDLVLNIMVARALDEKRINVFGGEQYRPLLDVKDVAHAIFDNLLTTQTGIYNLANQNLKILDLALKIRDILDSSIIIEAEEKKFEDLRNYRVSNKKAKEELGFTPKFSIEDSIKEIANLFYTGRVKFFKNNRFNNHLFLENHNQYN
jgi:nucleoside-diphosphate-sugar epimerase